MFINSINYLIILWFILYGTASGPGELSTALGGGWITLNSVCQVGVRSPTNSQACGSDWLVRTESENSHATNPIVMPTCSQCTIVQRSFWEGSMESGEIDIHGFIHVMKSRLFAPWYWCLLSRQTTWSVGNLRHPMYQSQCHWSDRHNSSDTLMRPHTWRGEHVALWYNHLWALPYRQQRDRSATACACPSVLARIGSGFHSSLVSRPLRPIRRSWATPSHMTRNGRSFSESEVAPAWERLFHW